MKTLFRFIVAIVMIACFSFSSKAQRQTALYIDNGFGGFTQITATGAGGTLNLPSSGTLLSSGASQTIDGLLTLGVNGSISPIAGELDILDGGNPGDTAALIWSGGLNIGFPNASTSAAAININGQGASTGSGGAVTINGGGSGDPSGNGGAVSITGGGSGATGGAASLSGGSAGVNGGAASVQGGSGGNGTGGAASLTGGGPASGNGGEVLVQGGAGGGPGSGGEAFFSGGNGGSVGAIGHDGGNLVAQGGNGGSGTITNGNGGSVSIQGGTPGSGAGSGGSIGSVSIQTSSGNTSIGNSGGTITITGTNWSVNGSGNGSFSGSVSTGGHVIYTSSATAAVSSNAVTVTDNPIFIITGTATGTIALTMPVSPATGDVIVVINQVTTNDAQNGSAAETVPAGGSRTFYYDGTSWQ